MFSFRFCFVVLLVCVCFVPLVSSQCGRTPTPEHCDHGDSSTCGNACCKLAFFVSESPLDSKHILENSLLSGGPENLYTLERPTCDPAAPLCYNQTAQFIDYSPYNLVNPEVGTVFYQGRATHTAPILLFNDTMDFTIGPNTLFVKQYPWALSVIKGFSISGIGGAFGDAGQNYYQLVTLLLNSGFTRVEWKQLDDSCPPPSNSKTDIKITRPNPLVPAL
eukprot:c1552_g1_i1.p1 GENE.c1552_g1_i1~~c1552_g1_i1.p1  ORF type:complete len:231 (-),score=96.49 c1552_g1_i1:20-679(-)